MSARVTGERVVTARGGFNPTWQRHVAAYALAEPHLPPGLIADLGCGVGHSYQLLTPRETVGIDAHVESLRGQERRTVAADMRVLPFGGCEFDGAIAVHSIEHVPDPERAVAEVVRVLKPAGAAVVVTPNRLTFARAEEIIDPYHYVEYDPAELERLLSPYFREVALAGIFGSERYLEFVAREHARLDRLLRLDPLRLRRAIPRTLRQRLYDWRLGRERRGADPAAEAIEVGDFSLGHTDLQHALDIVAICRRPVQD